MTQELVDSARALQPHLQEQTESIEKNRRLSAELSATLGAAGYYRMLAPRQFGGLEVGPSSFVAVLETLAAGNAAAAWCVMTGATTGLATGWLPEAGAERVWQQPDIGLAGVYAPMGKAKTQSSGYTLSGRWPFASGCENAGWLLGGAMVENEQGARQIAAFFPADAVEIIDTWDTLGLRGTGSHDIQVSSADIPESLTCNLSGPATQNTPLYRYPVFALLAHGVAAVATGLARRTLDDLLASMRNNAKRAANDALLQTELAQCEAALEAARSWVSRTLQTSWHAALENRELSTDIRAQLRLSANHAAGTAGDVITRCYRLAGGQALYRKHPLQRDLRDVQTLLQHVMVNPANERIAGRALLGVSVPAQW